MHVTGTKYKFAPLNKGMVKKSILVFFSVSYVCTSLDWWVQQCPKSLRAPWTAWALPEGQAADSLSSHVQLHTKLFTVLGLEEKHSSRRSTEIVPSQILQNTEKPTPAPCLSKPSQPATSITQLWATTDPIRAAQLLICLWQDVHSNLLLSDWWSSGHFE